MTEGRQYDYSLFGDAHVQLYLDTNGEEGYWWNGAPILILGTMGRRSGVIRRHALIYGEDADRYLLVASQGGAPDHPGWYKNLVVHPEVEVQIRGDLFVATARTADADEKPRLWAIMTAVWPNYDAYQERTDREIPLVVVERAPI